MPAGSLADYPDFGFDEVQVANVRRAQDLLAKDELERARAFLDQCDGERLPAATRSVLFAALCVRQRRFAEGLQHCAAVLAAAPGSMMAGALRAQCLRGLGRDEEALAQWQELLVRAPQEVAFHVGAAWAHLGLGRLDAAKAVIEAALARGLGDAELDTVNAMLVKAQKGPDWPRTFVHRSVHFEVASDIDLTVCREAATLLEQSFASYVDRLTPVADAAKRFRVFLFSGEAGYKRYVDDVVGGDLPIHTAGLYSPVLEQLLIWNLPDRDAMMRTVRHEGFHQYLDRVMRDAPRWLNEGLAEYHETARYQHNGWKLGQVRADHVRSLKVLRGPAPLASFLDVDPSAFYAKAQLHYAQSWAFVHFLLHSTPANEKRFRALWDRLIGGASAADAIAAVFPAAGIAPLETEFRAHVGALAKQ